MAEVVCVWWWCACAVQQSLQRVIVNQRARIAVTQSPLLYTKNAQFLVRIWLEFWKRLPLQCALRLVNPSVLCYNLRKQPNPRCTTNDREGHL